MAKVLIHDVTLREGEQVPGVEFSAATKVRIALELVRSGLRALEIGFVGVDADERACSILARKPETSGCETNLVVLPFDGFVERACGLDARHLMIIVPATQESAYGLFSRTLDEVLGDLEGWVRRLQGSGKTVGLALAHASRCSPRGLEELGRRLSHLRLSRVVFADTTGTLGPPQVAVAVKALRRGVRGSFPISLHLHNDFGVAVANVLAGVEAGAREVQVSVNGIGERAGLAPLAEVVLVLERLATISTGIDLRRLRALSRLVEEQTGILTSPRAPVVGEALFWYETATPILAMLKGKAELVEGISPDVLGEKRRFLAGKHSSRRLRKELLSRNAVLPPGFDDDGLRQAAWKSVREAAVAYRDALELAAADREVFMP